MHQYGVHHTPVAQLWICGAMELWWLWSSGDREMFMVMCSPAVAASNAALIEF